MAAQITNDFSYEISDDGYGKNCVKLLHVARHGQTHHIKELEVCTHLKLYSKRDYLFGDNSDIIATDSQKNTVYLLAKKFGVKSIEEFAMQLAKHFLTQYLHVEDVNVYVDEHPWRRIKHNHDKAPEHNHAFISTPTATRYCHVHQTRTSKCPTVISGLRELRVLKTTQSSFHGFVSDDYRSLPDTHDRIFSTKVKAYWKYATNENVHYDKVWHKVKDLILQRFAGDAVVGVHSPSVQNTMYLAEKDVLEQIPEVTSIKMEMPNIHYINFDTSKFSKVVGDGDNNEVFVALSNPSGFIFAQLNRKMIKSKL